MSTEYEKTLHRRMVLWSVAGVLSLMLMCLGYAVEIMYSERMINRDFRFAWYMFTICGAVMAVQCFGQVISARKKLKQGRMAEIEENDERIQQIATLAMAGVGKVSLAAAFAGMVISLVVVQLAVFWMCFALFFVEDISLIAFNAWYNSRL